MGKADWRLRTELYFFEVQSSIFSLGTLRSGRWMELGHVLSGAMHQEYRNKKCTGNASFRWSQEF